MKDFADIAFMNEIRFQMTRLIGISYLVGINAALISYQCGLKRLKWYVSPILTFAVFFVSRNYVLKNCIDRIYYPLQPVYSDVWIN